MIYWGIEDPVKVVGVLLCGILTMWTHPCTVQGASGQSPEVTFLVPDFKEEFQLMDEGRESRDRDPL